MPLPVTRVVTGLYLHPVTGQPQAGTVRFSPYPGFWTDQNDQQILTGESTLTLVNGAYSQALVVTDATEVRPDLGKLWRYEERISGEPRRTSFFALPTDDGLPISITDLIPVDPTTPGFTPTGSAGGDLVGTYPDPQLANTAQARTNLGLGDSATRSVGVGPGSVAAGDDARIVGSAQKAQNLADLPSASAARTNLGLGSVAVRNVGSLFGQVQDAEPIGLSTGVVSGGEMNINQLNPLAVDFGPTVAYIVDYVTSPTNPTVQRVSAPAQTYVLGDLVGPITWWWMDAGGIIHQQATKPTNSERRTRIQLGVTAQAGGVAIIAEQSLPVLPVQLANQLYDLMYALGAFSIDGNSIAAGGANLTIAKTAGTVFAPSFNHFAGSLVTNDPHVSLSAAQAPAQFRYVLRSTNPIPPTQTLLDPANFDVANVVTPVGGGANRATVQRVYLFASNATADQLAIQYGQTAYANLTDAIAAAATESYVVNPTVQANGVLLGFIAVTRTATDLSNPAQARFIPAARFGAGAAGSSTVPASDTAGATRAVHKTADESVTNSVTPQADDHLFMTVSPNGVYTLDMYLDAEADVAGDLLMGFTLPAGASISWTENGPSLGNSSNISSIKTQRNTGTTTSTLGVLAAGTGTAISPRGVLRVGATGGTLAFVWAQAAAVATPTTLKLGSWLRVHRII